MRAPSRVAFTDHAAERAVRFTVPYSDVADAVLAEHPRRQRNTGTANWVVRRGELTIVYDWPDAGDDGTARVVSLWLAG